MINVFQYAVTSNAVALDYEEINQKRPAKNIKN